MSCATMCEWIVDAWAEASALTAVGAVAKASIIAEQPTMHDSGNDEHV